MGRGPGSNSDSDVDLVLRRFTAEGVAARLSSIVATVLPFNSHAAPVIAAGTDALILASDPAGHALDIQRLGPSDDFSVFTVALAKIPQAAALRDYAATRRGPEAVLAWIDSVSDKHFAWVARMTP